MCIRDRYDDYVGFYTIVNGTTTYYNEGNSTSGSSQFLVARFDFESTYTLSLIHI